MLLSQVTVGKPWHVECGMSTNTFFSETPSINLRYISPKFIWSTNELTEEEVKEHPEYKNMRLVAEFIYTPPKEVIGAGFGIQYRLLRYKRFSLEVDGGIKFFFVPGPNFVNLGPLKDGREIWYLNMGLLCQLDLGFILPFVDVGGDRILTVGTEFNLRAIYKKPKRRYTLHPRKA